MGRINQSTNQQVPSCHNNYLTTIHQCHLNIHIIIQVLYSHLCMGTNLPIPQPDEEPIV